MKRYVGMDVSLKEASICVVDDDGEIQCKGTVISEPEAIAEFIEKHSSRFGDLRDAADVGGSSDARCRHEGGRVAPCVDGPPLARAFSSGGRI